ncbi:hypothetical protein EJ03DRAFT_330465 [Teratosphaeria nubilosa]|uniref:Peroxin 26 n=1 Tax=Teratosphaeria nubilosa TaxID=161662 RepID=A0A6G1L0Y4_9PEZI|nr:hypothetical protein EJ03DRAFT_330465 [Teratosphaeria nubilosa]
MTMQDSLDSQYLSSSLSSLHRSRSTNSLIVRAYKAATQLYLTKRFKEALETLEPIITAPGPAQTTEASQETLWNGHGASAQAAAPVAQSSRSTRTKVWVFYLSLLHAIIDLGPEEGKLQFGSTRWRQLANKAREGTVWEEIVQVGYGGQEGDVDPDVVVNLATLLLGHMPMQRLNQQRLETWLASCATAENATYASFADGTMTPNSQISSPKEFATKLKILELYTLHVLPANGEWTYAREFIEMNDTLDEERRDAFLNALTDLKEEKDGTAMRERELAERRERDMEESRKEEERQRAEQQRRDEERRKEEEAKRQPRTSSIKSDASTSSSKAPANGQAHPSSNGKPPTRPGSRASKKPSPPPPTFYNHASSVFTNLQQIALQASRNLAGGSSIAIFRMLLFALAFLVIMARRDLRLRVKRTLEDGWVKVKRTVGMGVKVSYI